MFEGSEETEVGRAPVIIRGNGRFICRLVLLVR